MATEICDAVTEIGEAAGLVWHYLDEEGPTLLTRLVKRAGPPRDLVMQALGWLAREDKLVFEQSGRRRLVRLRA